MSRPEVARYFALAQPKLRAYIRSLVFNRSDVDDILQEVAVAAIENADRYDKSKPVDAWVFGVTRNKILKYYEKTKRRTAHFSSELVDKITVSATEDASNTESVEALQSCLSKLPADKRQILLRRHEPGTTARKLAQEIGYTDTRMSRLINSLYVKLMNCIQLQDAK